MQGTKWWISLLAISVLLSGVILTACGGDDDDAGATETQVPAVASNLIISGDIVLGSKNIPEDQKPARSCVASSRFPRNSQMVWRVRIFDPATGNRMDDTQIATAEARLSNGVVVTLKYGAHPKAPPNEFFWTGNWVVPKDHPTGSLDYTVVVTATDGRTGEFKPFITATSKPAITDEVLADIATPVPVTPTP
jgi:hypothetical protein